MTLLLTLLLIVPNLNPFSANFQPMAAGSNFIADELEGAWETTTEDREGNALRLVFILQDGFCSTTLFTENEFGGTFGGAYEYTVDNLSLTYEFNTFETEKVGKTEEIQVNLEENFLELNNQQFKPIKESPGSPLVGAWLITGRMRDGEIARREIGARKTMKILTGTRFQWIAYNTETGQFSGSGGGTYTYQNGEYIEHIEFFSRDINRVGTDSAFKFEIVDGEWHHQGTNSRGEPTYEVWTKRIDLQ